MAITPYFRWFLINRIIGKEIYNNLNGETKPIVLRDAINQFQQEMIQKYGSFYKYFNIWCKRNGFNTPYEYSMWLAKSYGFSGVFNYKNHMAIKKGFKSKHEREKYWAKLRGETLQEAVKRNVKKRGFKSIKEYKNFLAKKAGFKNHSEREKYWGKNYKRKMKKEIEKEVKRVIEESRKENKDLEIIRKLKLQYSKQFFVRFPKNLEKLLGLERGKKVKFIIKIPQKGTGRNVDIKLELEK